MAFEHKWHQDVWYMSREAIDDLVKTFESLKEEEMSNPYNVTAYEGSVLTRDHIYPLVGKICRVFLKDTGRYFIGLLGLTRHESILREQVAVSGKQGIFPHQYQPEFPITLDKIKKIEILQEYHRFNHFDPENWLCEPEGVKAPKYCEKCRIKLPENDRYNVCEECLTEKVPRENPHGIIVGSASSEGIDPSVVRLPAGHTYTEIRGDKPSKGFKFKAFDSLLEDAKRLCPNRTPHHFVVSKKLHVYLMNHFGPNLTFAGINVLPPVSFDRNFEDNRIKLYDTAALPIGNAFCEMPQEEEMAPNESFTPEIFRVILDYAGLKYPDKEPKYFYVSEKQYRLLRDRYGPSVSSLPGYSPDDPFCGVCPIFIGVDETMFDEIKFVDDDSHILLSDTENNVLIHVKVTGKVSFEDVTIVEDDLPTPLTPSQFDEVYHQALMHNPDKRICCFMVSERQFRALAKVYGFDMKGYKWFYINGTSVHCFTFVGKELVTNDRQIIVVDKDNICLASSVFPVVEHFELKASIDKDAFEGKPIPKSNRIKGRKKGIWKNPTCHEVPRGHIKQITSWVKVQTPTGIVESPLPEEDGWELTKEYKWEGRQTIAYDFIKSGGADLLRVHDRDRQFNKEDTRDKINFKFKEPKQRAWIRDFGPIMVGEKYAVLEARRYRRYVPLPKKESEEYTDHILFKHLS